MIDPSRFALQTLWEDDEFTFSLGTQDGEPSTLFVLAPVLERPAPISVARLEHAYALRESLDSDWATRPLALVNYLGRPTLLLEHPNGEILGRSLGQPLELTQGLRFAIGISAALGRLHSRDLIHKDLKPENILVSRSTSETWLTGFGLTSRLPRHRQPPDPPEVIAGTLAYMAPEQTGRMNRSVDSRSDLYSLGVTFYEMFVGGLPFTASDPMEWVHCHIARLPVAPSLRRSEIPEPISAIILKLLAKASEERYQTAAGVEADLRRCLSALETHGRIGLFSLGALDVPDRLLIPEKLYGREREVELLLAAFDRVVRKRPTELVLVSGYSGVGKTSVVNELHKALVPSRALYAFGKFDQYKRDIPYATLAQAFQSLVRQILGQSDTEIVAWREALHEALGTIGQLMVNLIPELELVIGKQPPVADLPPKDSQSRFQIVFRRFLGVFARPEHPLALFLDDLQWLDAATLHLLEHLMTHDEVRHLLLIGAYRDNEVSASHPLMRTLAEIRRAGAPVHQIALAPLGLDDVGQLVADALRCERERAQSLAHIVHEKTDGNPFFTIQFIADLAEEGLLAFDLEAAAWIWDVDRIQSKGYTHNVVDLMIGKLNRFPETTQDSLKQLACLGNSAEIAVLSIVYGESEARLEAALWEAVRAGLVSRSDDTYTFVHDRVQEAAYALVPEGERATAHLRIGRALTSCMGAAEIEENIFEIVNQFNRSSPLIASQEELDRLAELNLMAGRRARSSMAYASALVYLSAAVALLSADSWERRYAFTFAIKLQRAECELLSANFPTAEQLIVELLQRAKTKVDSAAAYRLRIELHIIQSENNLAVESAVEGLRLFGLRMSPHPDRTELDAAFDEIWRKLAGREIETLIDLPLVTDPEVEATLGILCAMHEAAFYTDENLMGLQIYHTIRLTLEHGMTGASAHAFALFGKMLGNFYGRYAEGSRFAQFAVDLGAKHRLLPFEAKILKAKEEAFIWTHPVTVALDSIRAAFRAANQSGDILVACYACNHAVSDLLLRGDHLDDVWDETERGLALVLKAKFRDVADILVAQQRFIQNMRGRTASFSTFDDDKFDQASFEKQLTPQRMTAMVCWYWITKGRARFISGDFNEATSALEHARPILWVSHGRIQSLDYHLYSALLLTVGMRPGAWLPGHREQLSAHCRYLALWAETYPPTFADKHLLVTAEIARIEGRDLDAERLYEAAIRAAHENGFVHHEAMANEIAARFYAARGFETIADTYLRNARYCYLRWGADGKVRQLDEMHPRLRAKQPGLAATSTIGTQFEQLDLATVVKTSQAVSGEIVLGKLIEKLMKIAVEYAGAGRGLLILFRNDEPRIEAEATTSREGVEVAVRQVVVTPAALPESILKYVIRTRETVVLDDASVRNLYSEDEYVRRTRPRSVLCLPIVKQTKLVGALYLENNLTPCAFTSDRVAVLDLLASQAAISLENAQLYAELQQENLERKQAEEELRRSERLLAEGQRISRTGSWAWNIETGRIHWSVEQRRIFGILPDAGELTFADFARTIHPDDRPVVLRTIDDAIRVRGPFDHEFRIVLPDGEITCIHGSGRPVARELGEVCEYIGAVMDITSRKQAEDELRQSEAGLRKAQAELAHVTRVTTMGELAASIAHEVNQPISGVVLNGNGCLRLLAGVKEESENITEAREALQRIIRDGTRAGKIVERIRALFKKTESAKEPMDLNEAIGEIIVLARSEMNKHEVALTLELSSDLPRVLGDRVQLQQVMLNLILNAIDAMATVEDRARDLVIQTQRREEGEVLVTVRDSGIGLDSASMEKIFTAFHTTKPAGLGMGLSISRSIVENHSGRLWATAHEGPGAAFQFTLLAHRDAA